jgi:hypothetical protein
MGDRFEPEQLAAGLMAAHGRFGNSDYGNSPKYQPLAGLDESGNTAIITFHLAIVAISPEINYIRPAGPNWARFNPGRLMRYWGNRDQPWRPVGKRLARC